MSGIVFAYVISIVLEQMGYGCRFSSMIKSLSKIRKNYDEGAARSSYSLPLIECLYGISEMLEIMRREHKIVRTIFHAGKRGAFCDDDFTRILLAAKPVFLGMSGPNGCSREVAVIQLPYKIIDRHRAKPFIVRRRRSPPLEYIRWPPNFQ